MTWTIEFEQSAAKEFRKLDPQIRRQIRNFPQQRVLTGENPRPAPKPLRGVQSELWRYRVGSFRVIAHIQDDRIVILVVRVAHRRDVYK